jgi:outer membrane protein assembly factor BamD
MIMYDNLKKIYIKLVNLASIVILILLVGCSSKDLDMYIGLTAKQIYDQGKENANKGKFSAAVKDFEALESNYPYGKYADKAKLALIHAYHGKKEYLQAKAAADRFIRMYPNHPNVDYAYFMQGLSGYDQYYSMMYKIFNIDRSKREPNFAEQAFDDFKILLEKFPKSKYSEDAKQRMIHLRNELARYHLEVAEYYFNKKAYVSAINRANLIVTDFDETTVLRDAINIMILSYRALNIPELEKNSVNLLNINFGSIK